MCKKKQNVKCKSFFYGLPDLDFMTIITVKYICFNLSFKTIQKNDFAIFLRGLCLLYLLTQLKFTNCLFVNIMGVEIIQVSSSNNSSILFLLSAIELKQILILKVYVESIDFSVYMHFFDFVFETSHYQL